MLFDVAYRIAAIVLCLWGGNAVWYGFVERKITFYNTDLLDWWTPARQVFPRDVAPIRYWIVMSMRSSMTVLCFIGAIVGWQPNV